MTKFQLLMGNPAVVLSQKGFIKKALPGAKKNSKALPGAKKKSNTISRIFVFCENDYI